MKINEIYKLLSFVCLKKLNKQTLSARTFFSSTNIDELTFNFWKLSIFQKLSNEIKEVCNCSFFYWYRDIIPDCLNHIYSNTLDFKRIYFYSLAICDIDYLLTHVRYLEDNTSVVKKLRENNQY